MVWLRYKKIEKNTIKTSNIALNANKVISTILLDDLFRSNVVQTSNIYMSKNNR